MLLALYEYLIENGDIAKLFIIRLITLYYIVIPLLNELLFLFPHI